MQASDHPPLAQRPNWWKRNWKWFLPVLCVAAAIEAALFVLMIFAFLKSQGPYVEAMNRVRADSAVVQALGLPIEEGFLVVGNVRITGKSGRANMQIPIEGPSGHAIVFLAATKHEGVWEFTQLEVMVTSTRQRIRVSMDEIPADTP